MKTIFNFRPELSDIPIAFSLLSRIPVPVDHMRAGERLAESAWAWPIVGAVLGTIAGVSGLICLYLGAPPMLAALVTLTVLVLHTGAMHEDGLGDCADGFGGGRDKSHILDIMKDSRVGAYGAAAIALAFLARSQALGALPAEVFVAALAGTGALSRVAMALVMLMPNARQDGLSASAGHPQTLSVLIAISIALILCLLLFPASLPATVAAMLIFCLPLLWIAQRRIGGQTGDVLGGVQQLAEIGALFALATVLT